MKKRTLAPAEFPHGYPAERYWANLAFYDSINFGLGLVWSPGDVPTDFSVLRDSIDTFPLAENSAEVSECADNLFDEAVATKRGTIPRRAVVEMKIGPFTHIEFTELDVNVYAVLRATDGTSVIVCLEPRNHYCSFSTPIADDEQEKDRSIKAGVKLLLAAIIRDFWVIEERETAFTVRTQSTGGGHGHNDDDRPRMVYLPRVRYSHPPSIEQCRVDLGQTERRTHFVRAHLRRSETVADYQKVLAERYGFDVPMGYTFVRPHERGKKSRDVIYRSRSALNSLYTSNPQVQSTGVVRWFQFERDVYTLMEALGFEVQHISASRKPDNGVDVFATKGNDLDVVNWIIQCKCLGRRRKVYPATVRELIGTLANYPRGTRGMIVTTSSFSSGAHQAAQEHNLRLMDGQEFAKMLKGSGESPS